MRVENHPILEFPVRETVQFVFDGKKVEGLAGEPIAALGICNCLILLSPHARRQFGSPQAAGFSGFLIKPMRTRSLYERLGNGLQPGPSVAGEPAALAATLMHQPGAGLTVLVAEDNEINALLATRTLERFGCTAIWARDGREALKRVEASFAGTAPPLAQMCISDRRGALPEPDRGPGRPDRSARRHPDRLCQPRLRGLCLLYTSRCV